MVRLRPKSNPVRVFANRVPPVGLSREVLDVLRPFSRDDPDAPQVPGDLREEPTRIDTSVPMRTYWAGSAYKGLRATVVGYAPPGVGLVRYGEPGSGRLFYLATYLPIKKTRCGTIGCVAAPPLPAALKSYGESRDTMVQRDGWVVDQIAPRGSVDFNGTQILERVKELRYGALLTP